MALKAILDNLEGVAADVAGHYTKGDDGKFTLGVIEVGGLQLANIVNLQSALGKERENARSANEKLKVFEGLDPNKARDALRKIEDMASWSSDDKVKEQIAAVKSQMADAHNQEKAGYETRLASLVKSLEEAMIVSVASQALAEQKASVKLLMPHIRQQSRLREADGKFVTEVIGADGNPRLTGTDGHAMTIPELVAEMKGQDDFANAFDGTGASGTGAHGSNGQRGTRIPMEEFAKLPPAQRMARAQQMGITK